ncbi:hypothetical protein GQ53DRAFT_752408 [Thozetella sp. PMI_491]|nr:hypothetical protein GQ53DRAFT_752408 [Thozetella sp. PMI_491]
MRSCGLEDEASLWEERCFGKYRTRVALRGSLQVDSDEVFEPEEGADLQEGQHPFAYAFPLASFRVAWNDVSAARRKRKRPNARPGGEVERREGESTQNNGSEDAEEEDDDEGAELLHEFAVTNQSKGDTDELQEVEAEDYAAFGEAEAPPGANLEVWDPFAPWAFDEFRLL